MHVYELSKEYDISNKKFLEILKKIGVEAESHMSSLNSEDIEKIGNYFKKSRGKSSEPDNEESDNVTLLIAKKAKTTTNKENEDVSSNKEESDADKKKKVKIKTKPVTDKPFKHKESNTGKVVIKKHLTSQEEIKEKSEEIDKEENIEYESINKVIENVEENTVVDNIISKISEKEKINEKEIIVNDITKKVNEKDFEMIKDRKIKNEDKKIHFDKHKKEYENKGKQGFDKSSRKDKDKSGKVKDDGKQPIKKIRLNRFGQLQPEKEGEFGKHKVINKEGKKDIRIKDFKSKDGDNRFKSKDKGRIDNKFEGKSKSKDTINKFDEGFAEKQRRLPKDKGTKKHEKTQPEEKEFHIKKKKPKETKFNIPTSIQIPETISISDLAKKMNIKSSILISKFMEMGELVTINQVIDSDTAQLIALEFGCTVEKVSLYDQTIIEEEKDEEIDLFKRPPIVTVMGHVDHGKTKLLDAIRSTNKVATEFGGITQHIGAYKVRTKNGEDIVFLDTPGHEAFTSMRMRGAKVTDIVVLVVAADDGVMPQTIEALNHARAANVRIIVAINKIDSVGSNPERVKQQLANLGLLPDTWGGDTYTVEISALNHINIDQLLDTILFVAEDLHLKANPNKLANGTVIESKIDPSRGPVASVIITNGTLKIGSYFIVGMYKGKVRAMFDDNGIAIKEAPPSTPVEVLGIDGVPEAGDPFHEVKEEKTARQISSKRQEYKRYEAAKSVTHVTLDTLYGAIEDGFVKELNIVIKGDVQGSVEALKEYFVKLSDINKEVRIVVVHSATGGINESDVLLAGASGAIIIGFNVRASIRASEVASKEKVEIRRYNIIYDAVEDIKAAMEGLLSPEKRETITGQVEVREIFKISKVGTIAGCYVLNGYINRNSKVRVIREDVVIHTGTISTLKRFKDDAAEVREGFECGVSLERFNDLKVGDILEVFFVKEVARKL